MSNTVSGKLPFLGHTLEFMSNPIGLAQRGYEEHGEFFKIKIPSKDAYFLLGNDDSHFLYFETDKDLDITNAYPFFTQMFGDNFFFMGSGEHYQWQRDLVKSQLKAANMRDYIPIISEEIHHFFQKLKGEGQAELMSEFGTLTMKVGIHAFIGKEFRSEMGDNFFDVFRDFSEGINFTLPNWVLTKNKIKMFKAKKKLFGYLQNLINRRLADTNPPQDFFQSLVDLSKDDEHPMTQQMIIQITLLLMWAGHETTTGQVAWVLNDILQHQDIAMSYQAKIADILEEKGKNGFDLELQDLKAFDFIDRAILETERIHPIGFMTVRTAAKDTDYKGAFIEKGSLLISCANITHKLENFDRPWQYNPDRFLDKNNAKKLIGFGKANHRCIGVNFAKTEMKLIALLMLHYYDFNLTNEARLVQGKISGAGAPMSVKVRYQRLKDLPVLEATVKNTTAAAAGCPFHQGK